MRVKLENANKLNGYIFLMAHIDRQPSNEVFEDIKQSAVKVWNTYDNTYGYIDEKLERLETIVNYADNWYTFFGMMDSLNQLRLLSFLERQITLDFIEKVGHHYSLRVPFNFMIKEN